MSDAIGALARNWPSSSNGSDLDGTAASAEPGTPDRETLRDRLDAVVWELVPRQNDTAWGTDDA